MLYIIDNSLKEKYMFILINILKKIYKHHEFKDNLIKNLTGNLRGKTLVNWKSPFSHRENLP